MAREYDRHVRVGDQIQRIVAQVIAQKMRDPRLSLVTVSQVDVSRDLRYATVYITRLQEGSANELERILNKASGLFRRAIGRQLAIRGVPQLRFAFDHHLQHAKDLSDLIERAVASDQPATDGDVEGWDSHG